MSLPPILDNKHPDAPSVFEPPHCCEKPDVRKARPPSTCHRFAFLIQMATSFAVSRSPALQSASKIGLVTILIFTAFRSQTKPLASSHVLLERLSPFWLPKNSLRADANS